MSHRYLVLPAAFLLVALVPNDLPGTSGATSGVLDPVAGRAPEILSREPDVSSFPLYFIENRGQADARAPYYLQGGGASVFFTEGGLRISLADQGGISQRWGLRLDFLGASPTSPVGRDRTDAVVSYFKGPPEDWVTGLPTYTGVLYRGLWPGVDLRFSGEGDRLKYEFLVSPGADPERIRLEWRGATSLSRGPDGGLLVRTPAGSLTDEAPFAYHEVGGHRNRVGVPVAYDLQGSVYGFRVGDYDPSLPLVIDPHLFVYAGFIGGSAADLGRGVAVDAKGAAYVTGFTSSTEATFPVTVGPDLDWNGSQDAFVAKVARNGSDLVYAGYIGGSGMDNASGVAVDAAGAAYVAGETESDEVTFPVTVGPDVEFNGDFDGFVAKVAPDGTGLEYAGYIGGLGEDGAFGVAVDAAGAAYVAGDAASDEATFPVTVGPDTTWNGVVDAFVAKVTPDGSDLAYAGYIGGSGQEGAFGVAVDTAGAAYVAGSTESDEVSFPATVGPDVEFGGDYDAFVAKVKPDGTGLDYAGYVGGLGADFGNDVAVDTDGAAHVAGITASDQVTFPATVGPDLTYNGGVDSFVAKVKPSGTGFAYAGYIGGSGFEAGHGVAVDAAGAAYVAGLTESPEATFPEKVGPDLTYEGGGDGFVARVRPSGTGLGYAGYVGGSGADEARGVAVDRAGAAYVVGQTSSDETMMFPAKVGPDLSHNGGSDAFVAKVRTTYRCRAKLVTHLGGPRRDVLAGTGKRDVFLSGGGRDLLRGRKGSDLACAGKGKDKVVGGDGGDTLLGQGGRDVLVGGRGNDLLVGGPGFDTCKPGPGRDRLRGCERIV